MAELPPPPNRKGGWYPDPERSGRLRFWNKTRWTDEFRDAPGGEAKPSDSAPVPGPPPPAGEKPSDSGAPSPSGSGTGPQPPKQRGRWLGAPWWAWLIGAFLVLAVVSAIAGGSDSGNDNSSSNDTANNADTPSVKTVTQAAPAQPAPEPTATAPAEPDLTAGQENALRAAQDYIDFTGFSKAGLIQQLSHRQAKVSRGLTRRTLRTT